jgi:hypothetical protein
MSTTRPRFRESALASGLVSEEQIRSALGDILQSNKARVLSSDISDKELAAKLIEQTVITPYQADQMLSGKSRLSLGPYIITDWIGQGGMGQVFKAVHQMLGRECAVKVLPINKTTPEAIEHFRREIRTQARLDHPNLVRAYDAGVDGNVHYLVVEYVPGLDLRRLVRSKGKLSVHQAASIIKQAAEGLAHAHTRGLIHRDIKPGNIRPGVLLSGRTRPPRGESRRDRRLPLPRTNQIAQRCLRSERHLLTGLHALLRHHQQGPLSRRHDADQGEAASR